MKIKIFSSNNINNLEKIVNDFIKDKIIHDIKFFSITVPKRYTNCVPTTFDIIDLVMIQYDGTSINNKTDVNMEIIDAMNTVYTSKKED